MARFIENFSQLIGIITQPFERDDSGKMAIYKTRMEVDYGSKGRLNLEVRFYEKKENNPVDFEKNLTGKKVLLHGYLQGDQYKNKTTGNYYDILRYIATDLLVLSQTVSSETNIKASSNLVVNEDDLPF